METKNISITYRDYELMDNLTLEDKCLFEEAIKATSGSYAPYSNFNVGAAVLMENGEIISGSNQENAAFPSGLCAERVALFAAHHRFPSTPVKAIAVVAKINGAITENITYPCAACIQVMLESQKRAGAAIKIIVGSATKIQVINSVNDLLPFSFNDLPEK